MEKGIVRGYIRVSLSIENGKIETAGGMVGGTRLLQVRNSLLRIALVILYQYKTMSMQDIVR